MIPESNLHESQTLSESVIELPGASVLSQRDDKYGVRTDPGLPQFYGMRFADLLSHNGVFYHGADVICANPFERDENKARATKVEFERQLKFFRRIYNMPKNLSSKITAHLSGKVDKDNKRTNRLRDDLVMACLVGVYWAAQYKNNLCRERGNGGQFYSATGNKPLAPIIDSAASQQIINDSPLFRFTARRE